MKTTRRKIKDGAEVRYLRLAHDEWDPAKRQYRAAGPVQFGPAGTPWTTTRSSGWSASLSPGCWIPADALAATTGS